MKKLNARKLLLIDGIGALVSALFLGVVLVVLQPHIGMPVETLHLLAILAVIFAIYSFGSYFLLKEKWSYYLQIIALVNLSYCLLTLGLVIKYFEKLTLLGLAYFGIEILIIFILVRLELTTAKSKIK